MENSNLTLMKMRDMQTPVVLNKTMSLPISSLNKISMEIQKTLQSTNKRIKTTQPMHHQREGIVRRELVLIKQKPHQREE